ncbi:50S ribosomal protein L28 [Buchnera aphidicola]|uniref:Large ribosomal subunit protein bL28 n=1 Tax=Buchnera aphidicola (Sarucallis kahawaluokalani) TaxID=1241878 RepID=A0A4D6YLN6_9GAMM|nr:50S ribosomal protein L28 [Buchnera aphidicola]QCI25865.1 50S ribosomal protein L28 [Buchnera aphidicola (Sarucallis kahawaluokalani)]
MNTMCMITKKKPMFGNNRSHALNATKKKFLPNLQYRKLWMPIKKKFIKIRISAKEIKIIDKIGIENFLKLK